MKALLVHPKCPEMTFWNMGGIIKKFTDKKAAHIPLGLLTIASMLPKNWTLKLVDENVEELTDENILWADIVLLGAMLIQKERAQKIIAHCNKLGKKVVIGGPFFTTCDDEDLKGADYILQGEVEDTIHIFLDDFERGVTKQIYPIPKKRPDITKTPIPMWELINFDDYVTMAVQHSRGCPYDCEFCDIVTMYGKHPRVKKPEQMIAEFQSLYDADWRGPVFIVDDNFIGNKIKVKKMLRWLIDWQRRYGYPFHFVTQASIDIARDNELLELMREVNFREVFIGIESVSIESLEECGKFQNLNLGISFVDAIRKIQAYGIQVMASLIIGFDHDPPDVAKKSINLIREIDVPTFQISRLSVLYKTRLYERLFKEGRIKGSATGENTDGSTNILYPKDIEERLNAAFNEIFTTIYSAPELYRRIWNLVKSLPPNTRGNVFRVSSAKTLLKSFWKIGILAKGRRFLFWKLIAKTLLFSWRNFPVLIKHFVFGEHLIEITERFRG